MSISVKFRIAEFEQRQRYAAAAWSPPRSTQTVGAHETRAIGLSGVQLFANRSACADAQVQTASIRWAGSMSSSCGWRGFIVRNQFG
ncbi:hypothetical protein HXX76_002354 [Chlamydomonas incerta]|nr:hypothetical protein HXX76_002354 [Chlamydomonas incerta]|eukprot:KAG2442267.1 hypothetical protein HXX76_002354 [Chlamydomonas incerta]